MKWMKKVLFFSGCLRGWDEYVVCCLFYSIDVAIESWKTTTFLACWFGFGNFYRGYRSHWYKTTTGNCRYFDIEWTWVKWNKWDWLIKTEKEMVSTHVMYKSLKVFFKIQTVIKISIIN